MFTAGLVLQSSPSFEEPRPRTEHNGEGFRMRIAFFGLPLAALALLRAGHDVALAAISRRDAPGLRRLRKKIGDENVWVQPKMGIAFLARVRAASPDLVVSWFWTKKLPMDVVGAAHRGGFGVHPSLLPRWRGPDPYFWTIDAGDVETGVTAHRIDAEYDTGAILARRFITIDPHWDSWQLARALDAPSLDLMLATVDVFARQGSPIETPQDARAVTLAPAPDEAMLEIDWSRPADAIVRRIRAAAPYPGAWTFVGDEALVITRAEMVERPRGLEPGEGAVVDGRAVVAASSGGVALVRGRVVRDDDADEGEDGEAAREDPVETRQIAALLTATKMPVVDDSR
jgi:methionyl-tRNA formyltransferase